MSLRAAMLATGLATGLMALTASAAWATTPQDLYNSGQYQAAIEAGVAAKDAAGFAVAARSVLAEERMRAAPCLACVKRAEHYAREAIAADPAQPDGHVFLAAALGYEGRIIGTIAAKMDGYASEAKKNLDTALAHQPNDPWALAAMGGWNIAVVNGGGAILADMMYGASVKQGLAYYQKAFAADPGNIPVRFQYALSLSGYDRQTYAKQIAAALNAVVTGKPRTAYEVFMQGQARQLLADFNRGNWNAYAALMKRLQGYPQ